MLKLRLLLRDPSSAWIERAARLWGRPRAWEAEVEAVAEAPAAAAAAAASWSAESWSVSRRWLSHSGLLMPVAEAWSWSLSLRAARTDMRVSVT